MPESGTPDTLAYMILGYIAAGIIFAALIFYLVAKARTLRAEAAMLRQLEAEEQSGSASPGAQDATG